MLVEVELYQIVISEGSLQQGIVLKEKDGDRTIPIFIGPYEASAIERKIKNFQVPRPFTHDLLLNTIEKLGGKLNRIVINDLRDETFFALLIVSRDGETLEIDSRPSDAIALAVRNSAPIFAEDHVIKRANVPK